MLLTGAGARFCGGGDLKSFAGRDDLPVHLREILGPLHTAIAEEHVNPEFVETFGDVYRRQYRVAYDGKLKLIRTSRGERHLFDLATDPDENDNLASSDAARLSLMEGKLDAAFAGSAPMMTPAP